MDTDLFLLDCQLQLTPVWFEKYPYITLTFGDKIVYTGRLVESAVFAIRESLPAGNYAIELTFNNKTDSDSKLDQGLDMAVLIDRIEFNGMSDSRFIWEGEYRPIYNPEWVKQQQTAPDTVLKNATYLGWNGTWRLDFTVPIFTWIHKTLSFGWIYD